ncbi:hypothetical protein JXA63_01050 [Candidatus Woesebacteria bacterium]|nr:hypothetical protein [Candidatus Woesebacteria bacterium]
MDQLTNKHTCQAMVVACIDFRFQKYLRKFEDENIHGGYDLLTFAGGVKQLDQVLEEIDISKRLHEIHELYLVNHENCGAYGEESTYENHKRDLEKAYNAVKEKYPDINIHKYYLHLDGQFEKID